MLEVRGLHAGYGRIPILTGVDLSVSEGEVVGVLGHNGMGKTTLIRTLMGYTPATAGTIAYRGQDITSLVTHRRARAGIGHVPQGREIFHGLTVLDNLRMGALNSLPETVERVLDEFPYLCDMLDRPGAALSGGEQQILAVARSLCAEPDLLLLDEPTEGIQPSIIEQISELLTGLNRDRGLTLVVVEQNLEFIAGLAKRVLIIQKGAIVRELEPGQLKDTEIIDEFVGSRA